MDRFSKFVLFFCFIHLSAFAAEIKTFYGTLDVEEPVLLELIESPAFQRLKEIHQYGVAYYTTHREEYTRYDHSLGVFYLLRVNGCLLEEQIAGLLHDVSHTVFSHVGDWIFNRQDQEQDFQTLTHRDYLEKCIEGKGWPKSYDLFKNVKSLEQDLKIQKNTGHTQHYVNEWRHKKGLSVEESSWIGSTIFKFIVTAAADYFILKKIWS